MINELKYCNATTEEISDVCVMKYCSRYMNIANGITLTSCDSVIAILDTDHDMLFLLPEWDSSLLHIHHINKFLKAFGVNIFITKSMVHKGLQNVIVVDKFEFIS